MSLNIKIFIYLISFLFFHVFQYYFIYVSPNYLQFLININKKIIYNYIM